MKLLLLLALGTITVRAQSTISSTDRHAHGVNFGWINCRPSPADGLAVHETTLSGRAWSANFGWISFGDGAPVNGHAYANDSAADYGVNLAPGGQLTGHAWSANAGWITFEQAHGRPRIDLLTGQFHGHAWSANAGWIHLDPGQSDLRTASIATADADNDGLGDAWERQHFGSLTAASATTNADSDPASDLDEYRAGTAPLLADDWLQVVSQSLAPSGNSLTLRFNTAPGRLYRMESSGDLQTWNAGSTFSPDAGPVTEKIIPLPAGSRGFFRVTAVRPLP